MKIYPELLSDFPKFTCTMPLFWIQILFVFNLIGEFDEFCDEEILKTAFYNYSV